MQLARSLLERDFKEAKEVLDQTTTHSLSLKESSIFKWGLEISGARQTMWHGLTYDVEIHFSRRHPFEPPAVYFSKTSRNFKNPRHHLVDPTGRVRLESLSLDAWMPTTDGRTLISWISDLFTLSTPYATAVCPREDALSGLSRELMRHIASFLKPVELGALGAVNRNLLAVAHSEPLWAMYYCRSCPGPMALHRIGQDMGPLRVLAENGLWYWKDAREAYIRANDMQRARAGPVPIEYMSLETYAWREAAGLSIIVELLQQEANRGNRQSFFEALLGPLNARLQSLCRVVGYEVKSNSVAFLLSRVERLCRTFLHSGFTADTIIESTYRHGLLQFAVDDLRIEAPACIVPPQQPDAPRDTEPATLSDYLQAWGGLVNVVMRSSRVFETGQQVDVFDREGQWLSASVLPTSGHCGRSTNSQLLHREIAREGLSLQSLFRLQALNAPTAPWDTMLISNDAQEPRPQPSGKQRRPRPAIGPFAAGHQNQGVEEDNFDEDWVEEEEAKDDGDQHGQGADLDDNDAMVQAAPQADAHPPAFPPALPPFPAHPPHQYHQAAAAVLQQLPPPIAPPPQVLAAVNAMAAQNPYVQMNQGPQPPAPPAPHAHAPPPPPPAPVAVYHHQVKRAVHNGILVHFDGHRSSFDEWVPWTCDRIMPYRTRSRRPITLAAEAVRDMIKDLNHDENCFLARPDAMEIRLQCFWLDNSKAGGLMRYLVPPTMSVEQIRDDFCALFGLDPSTAVLVKATGRFSPDVLKSQLHMRELDPTKTLQQAGVRPRDFLEIEIRQP